MQSIQNKWSIIPLLGGTDPKRGKRPALRWQPFAQQRPGPDTLRTWFAAGDATAYGLVCGRVSGLVVLDIDEPALAMRFAQAFPQLSRTRIVRSGMRGTPHFYWRVDFPVKSRAFAGADLKAEGSYVVGAGSCIAGSTWELLSDVHARSITQAELDSVLAFFQPKAAPVQATLPTASPGQDYVALYAALIQRLGGRNKALFTTACAMRDAGCSQAQTVETLVHRHVKQLSLGGVQTENALSRRIEALATIRSAYSRPPRKRQQKTAFVPRVANLVRETLLLRPDGAAILRTIEGAYLSGIAPGQSVSEALLCRLLHGVVSRDSIRKALNASYATGESIFGPPGNPPAVAEIPDGMCRQKHAVLSGGQKRTKPARHFVLPSPRQMAKALGLHARGGDALSLDDLRSPRLYRQALHRGLLQRRPGAYSSALLARRLGISARSIRRYHREMPIKAQPTYRETPVLWSTLEQIPPAEDLERYQIRSYGEFLIDQTGKKWPLKREIAAMLLGRGQRVSRMRQGVNHYSYESLPAVKATSQETVSAAKSEEAPARPVQPPDSAPQGDFRPLTAESWVNSPPPAQKAAVRRSKRRFRRPLPNSQAEYAALSLHREIPSLSLPNARRLVETYDASTIMAALRKYRWLKSRRQFDNPAGYFVTLARVSWRSRHPGSPAPKFEAEPERRSRRSAYVAPQDDPLWQSESYQQWRSEFFAGLNEFGGGSTDEIAF